MSKTEDYLDSLLSAVSDGSAGRVVRRDSNASNRESKKESRYSRRKSAVSDKRFIDEFENELMLDDADETDEFLKAFEMELDEDVSADLFGAISEDEDKTINEIEETSQPVNLEEEQAGSSEFDTDSLLSEAMSIINDEMPMASDEEALNDDTSIEETANEDSQSGDAPDINDSEISDLDINESDINSTELEENLEDISDLASDDQVDKLVEETDEKEVIFPDEEEPVLIDESEDLMDILDSNQVNDEEMADIGDLLKSLDNDEVVQADENSGGEASILEELEALSAETGVDKESHSAGGIDDFEDDVVEVEAQADVESEDTEKSKKKKSRKEKNKDKKEKNKEKKEKGEGGFLAKLAKIFFGDDEEEEGVTPVGTEGLESLTDENLAIIADLEADAASAKDDKKDKKGKKEKKPKEKKPKKEKPKKEKKPKPPKEKKPKKPVDPNSLDLTPPLPKAPVILIFVMAVSFVVLTVLSTNLLDKSNMEISARDSFKDKDYVKAYTFYTGKKLDEKGLKQKEKYEVLATVQAELNDYLNLMYVKQYDMAIDALVCAVGRYSVNYDDAISNEIEVQYGELHEKILEELEKLGISEADVLAIYEIRDREEYSRQVYKLAESLGYEETE